MFRRGEHALDRALFDDLPRLHHADPLRDPAHDAEVVGDEQKRHAEPLLQIFQQRQDLRLHGDVERRGRLVGDEEVGLVGERHGDHHALALAARQLMRIAAEAPLRVGYADLGQHLDGARARRLTGEAAMEQQDFADLLLDGVQRVERGHRLLEHDGDVVAAHLPHVAFGQLQKFAVLEGDGPRRMPRRRVRQQFEDRQRRHRFAGAGFPDQRHRLALADIERDAIDGEHLAPAVAEGDGEVADGEERGGGHFSARNKLSMPSLSVPMRRIPDGSQL